MEDSALKSEKNCNVWKIHTTCHYMLTLFNIKGAKVTISTSAYALPLFLPRPEKTKQKAPVKGKNNLKFLSPPRYDLPLFGTDWRPCSYLN